MGVPTVVRAARSQVLEPMRRLCVQPMNPELRTVAGIQVRYEALEAEWEALKRAGSWHDAWGRANVLSSLALAIVLSTDWKPQKPAAMAVALATVASLVAQCLVWWRGHRARGRVLSEYQRTNEELERLVRDL